MTDPETARIREITGELDMLSLDVPLCPACRAAQDAREARRKELHREMHALFHARDGTICGRGCLGFYEYQ